MGSIADMIAVTRVLFLLFISMSDETVPGGKQRTYYSSVACFKDTTQVSYIIYST